MIHNFKNCGFGREGLTPGYPAAVLIQFRCLTPESFYSQITAPKANFSLQNDAPVLCCELHTQPLLTGRFENSANHSSQACVAQAWDKTIPA